MSAAGANRLEDELRTRDAFWPAQVATAAAIGLYFLLPGKLVVGPSWLMPIVEGVLLVGLILATPHSNMVKRSSGHRGVALALIALVSIVNFVALAALVHFLVAGGKTGGHPLLLAGVEIWGTNVLVFAVWFWELDRGGPQTRARPGAGMGAHVDFLFPQMTDDDYKAWKPNFVDYLYVSFTNATAFSPTDTMPLTGRAKMLMLVQSLAALITVGLVAARAVNILG